MLKKTLFNINTLTNDDKFLKLNIEIVLII